MGARAAVLGCAVCALACGQTAFVCSDDAQCIDGGAAGTCQENGFCSFDDPGCPSGQRYGALAGDGVAGACVDPLPATSSGDGADVSSGAPPPLGSSSDSGPPPPPADWWNTAWTRRQRLMLDAASLMQDQQEVPVLVLVDADRIDIDAVADGGADLRFVGPNGETVLEHELEAWDPAGRSAVWVRVPRVVSGDTGQENYAWLYYGNPDPPDPTPADAVWSQGYVGVWHLDAEVEDATQISDAPSVLATQVEPGRIGNAHRFGLVDASIEIGTSSELSNLPVEGITVSAWILPETFGERTSGRVVDKADAIAPAAGFSFEVNDGSAGNESLQFDRAGVAEGAWRSPDGSITLGEWHLVAVTFRDDDEPVFYVDGVQMAAVELLPWGPPPDSDAMVPLFIGNDAGSSREFEGILDEVRIFAGIRPPGWFEVQYDSGADLLVSFGAVESLPM